MLFLELELTNERILVNLEKAQSIMPTKQIDGSPATLLIVGEQQYIVTSPYEYIKERIFKQQGGVYQSEAIRRMM